MNTIKSYIQKIIHTHLKALPINYHDAQHEFLQGAFFEQQAHDHEGNTHLSIQVQHENRNAVWNFLSAALRGHSEAQYKLGMSYLNGELGLDRNYTHAEEWLSKAAQQGHSEANTVLQKALDKIAFS